MATQIGAIKVQIGNQRPTVSSISYGARTLKSATDLNIGSPQTGDAILYDAANNNFYIANPASSIPDLDAGFF